MSRADVSSHAHQLPRWVRRATGTLVCVLAVMGAAAVYVHHILTDPRITLLLPEQGAGWIKPDTPFSLMASRGETASLFRTRLPAGALRDPGGVLHVLALGKRCTVWLDGDQQSLIELEPHPVDWKHAHRFELTPALLGSREHLLNIMVENTNGPSLALAYCQELNLRTGTNGWEASADGKRFAPAGAADAPQDPPLANLFVPRPRQLAPWLALIACIFAGSCIACAAVAKRCARAVQSERTFDAAGDRLARRVRLVVLIAWTLLAVNNIPRVPLYIGYDASMHLDYIVFIAQHHRLPLPQQGLQFFQSPLYYIVSAVLFRALTPWFSLTTVGMLLRIIPLACGVLMVEICYRAARNAFPRRGDLQVIGTLVGGLLPMNIYMAQALSNEPLAAVFSAAMIAYVLRLMHQPERLRLLRSAATCGLILGLALLTKVSAIVLIIPVCATLAVLLVRRTGASAFRVGQYLAVLLITAGAVCGWYYIRNWIAVGRPFVAGWDPARIPWWQEPGYRVPAHFYRFGRALVQPVFAGTRGLWDSLYSTCWTDGFLSGMSEFRGRPPWNYSLMSIGAWLALAPSVLLLVGVSRPLFSRPAQADTKSATPRLAIAFAAACLGCFLLAMIHLYLTLPAYGCGKASYFLGLTPCIAVLAAAGFDRLPRHPWPRFIAAALVITWAANAYLTYLVL